MSHEWNCRCPRCLADEAKYTGADPREDERYAEMVGSGEWDERHIPNLADFEARP